MIKRTLAILTAISVTILVSCVPNSRDAGRKNVQPSAPAQPVPGPISGTPMEASTVAGPGSGNGGKGVLINGKPYLFDLVESGVEKDPYFNPKIEVGEDIRKRVAKVFAADPSYPVELIARKLSEVMSLYYAAGILMLNSMEAFRWRIVDKSPMPVDDQRKGIHVDPQHYVQLAERLSRSIIINREQWLKMDEGNRTALIFHEVIYAFAKPKKTRSGYFSQDTGAIQELTAFLFSPDLFTSYNLGLMAANVLPEEMKFGGERLVNDNISGFVDLPQEIVFYLAKGFEDNDPKMVDQIPLVLVALNRQSDRLVEKVCSSLGEGEFLIKYSTSNEIRHIYLDSYEGAADKFYSYVKVDIRKIGAAKDSIQGSSSFNKNNCRDMAVKIYAKAAEHVLFGTKITKDR